MNKNLYIIAGCNGAGKTTASLTILPEVLHCREFINADEIAKGLSPLNPESVAVQAGKLMLQRFEYLLKSGETFAVETTLATKTYIKKIKQAQAKGYTVTLLFFSLDSTELAIDRVKYRVQEGGHNIPTDTIKRRYAMGLKYLFDDYLPIVDNAYIYDNSKKELELLAEKIDNELVIYQSQHYERLKHYATTN